MNYETLRERICEILPDLKELTFGCEVESPVILNNGHHRMFICLNEKYCIEKSDIDRTHYLQSFPISGLKPLGRDPSLADVLRAIGQNREIFVGSSGNFYKGWNDWNKPLAVWNLTKNLSGQSPEVWEFLGELLK